jgi:tight adherence protein B
MSKVLSLRAWLMSLAATIALLGALVTPAAATAPASLSVTEGGGATFPARSLVLSLPGRSSLTASQVHVSENGGTVASPIVRPIASAASGDFGVVLAIDVSSSMRGAPLAEAMKAARALAAQRTGKQELGIVTFDRQAAVALPLTSDAGEIARALRRTPRVGSGAYIYNGLTVAVQQLVRAKIAAGAVILLSDGASEGAKPVPGHSVTAHTVGAAAAAAHAQIYTVGLRDSSYTPARMSLLARVGGGEFIESDSSQLSSVFTRIESQLTSAYVIHYRSFAPLGHRVAVTVRVDGVAQAATLAYETPAPPRATNTQPPHTKSFWTGTPALAVFAALGALLIGLAVFVFLLPRLRAQGLRGRVDDFTMTPALPEAVVARSSTTSWPLRPLERLLERTRWWERFQSNVEIARLHRTAIELVGWCALMTVGVAVLVELALGTPIPAIIVLALGPVLLNAYVKRSLSRQRDLFAEQLPSLLQELASSMRAGHALVAAMASMANAAPEPSHSEWSRVLADEQLGVPLQDALTPMAERMKSEDVGQVALVAALHTRTGGNMAEVLERVSDSVRERGELRRELRSLTGQARLSRYVVTALPFGVGTFITIINPDYEKPLFETTTGIVVFIFAIVLVAIGSLWMRAITEIEA